MLIVNQFKEFNLSTKLIKLTNEKLFDYNGEINREMQLNCRM